MVGADPPTVLRPLELKTQRCSGDGTLSALNMRKMELAKRSDYMDEELLSVGIMKHGAKVVCGTQVCGRGGAQEMCVVF